ncbi:MAG TPA: prepilin peptidase [Methylomirabilota bacterium]|jgi:leader peptidase (prepilin peptidase)/N-methyltransferase
MVLAFCALAGLCVGSFLNVVIARVPAGRSIAHPPSACPHCGTAIAWYDNLPVLSYLLLGARCRACRTSISWRYPVVEVMGAGLFALAYLRFGPSFRLATGLVLVSMLIAIAGIDLDHQIIPDVLSLPGVALGFIASFGPGAIGWKESALGVLVGGGVFVVIIAASSLVLGQPGMGVGDVKLGAMLGAFLGWQLALLSILLSVLVGGLVAAGLMAAGRKGRKDAVPFGPFLALGGLVSFLGGDALLTWYFGQFLG